MESIVILGHAIPVEFKITDPAAVVDRQEVMALAQSMAALINDVGRDDPWTADQALAFRIMTRIVFFQGKVVVNGTEMDRPCCDEDDAVFYWKISEFLFNRDDDVHANTFFHDCWHVVQFRRRGDFARTEEERLDREVDATSRQIEVARKLGCSAAEVDFLIAFSEDPERIRIRLAEGVGPRPAAPNAAAPHLPGAMSFNPPVGQG